MKKVVQNIVKKINKSKRVCITSHIRPDGDSIGSGLATYLMLKQFNKDVFFYNADKAPYPLTELPHYDVIEFKQIYEEDFDLVILIEGAGEKRNGQKKLDRFYTINIDHHSTSERNANINWVVPEVSAVGELIFELGKALGIEFTKDICFNLFAAISSDTGSFKYSNTSDSSLFIASELVRMGNFKPYEVSDLLFNSNPYEKIEMISKVLSTLEMKLNNQVSIITFKREFLKNMDLKEIETEDIITIARSIIGVKVTLFFKEIDNDYYRVSIRSKGEINSQEIAKKFNGGGHNHAAGFFYKGNLEESKDIILKEIEKQFK